MSDKTKVLLGSLIVGLGLLAALSWSWYRAELQSRVYLREGIEVSAWEVWMGARPAERTINLK